MDDVTNEQPAPQVVVQQADPRQVAAAVIGELAPQLKGISSQQGQQQAVDAVTQAVNALQAQGFSLENALQMTLPAQALRNEFMAREQQMRSEFAQHLRTSGATQTQASRAMEIINRHFEKYEDDPAIAENEESIMKRARKKMEADPNFMNAWRTGDVPERQLKQFYKAATDEFLKSVGRESSAKEGASPPLRTSGNVAGAAKNKETEAPLPDNEDQLNEHQRSLYYAMLEKGKTYLNKSGKDLQQYAMSTALKAPGSPTPKRRIAF